MKCLSDPVSRTNLTRRARHRHLLLLLTSGGSRWGPGGTGPPNLAQASQFCSGSVVISLSHCCFPNDEGPGLPNIFFLEPPLLLTYLPFVTFDSHVGTEGLGELPSCALQFVFCTTQKI